MLDHMPGSMGDNNSSTSEAHDPAFRLAQVNSGTAQKCLQKALAQSTCQLLTFAVGYNICCELLSFLCCYCSLLVRWRAIAAHSFEAHQGDGMCNAPLFLARSHAVLSPLLQHELWPKAHETRTMQRLQLLMSCIEAKCDPAMTIPTRIVTNVQDSDTPQLLPLELPARIAAETPVPPGMLCEFIATTEVGLYGLMQHTHSLFSQSTL
jgi:hypothetical protein